MPSLDASQRGYLFPEYEIVVDPEDVDAATLAKSPSEATKEPTVEAEAILSNVPKNVHVWDDAGMCFVCALMNARGLTLLTVVYR